MKIVISGGLGYVGGRLCKYLTEQGHFVTALSRQANKLPSFSVPDNLTIAHPDTIIDKPALLKGVDAFIHLAALNENDCIKNPFDAIHVNIAQTLRWLDCAYTAGVRKFIYFSTAHVYGKPLQGYYDESSLTKPVHPYAITHKCAEDYVLSYREEKGMDSLVVRLTNSFGGPAFPTADRWTLLVNDLCRSAVENGTMTLLSDGLQNRDFVCLEDVCQGVALLLAKSNDRIDNGLYNLGSGNSRSVWDLTLQIKQVAAKILNHSIELSRKEPKSEITQSILINIDKMKNLGFVVNNNVEREIQSTIEYFKK